MVHMNGLKMIVNFTNRIEHMPCIHHELGQLEKNGKNKLNEIKFLKIFDQKMKFIEKSWLSQVLCICYKFGVKSSSLLKFFIWIFALRIEW